MYDYALLSADETEKIFRKFPIRFPLLPLQLLLRTENHVFSAGNGLG